MSSKLSARALSILFASTLAFAPPAARPQTAAPPPPQDEEVVRVNSALVQTDVTVLDKEGRFVEGLKPEQMELLVDGKPRPVSFFEAVKAGAPDEEAQLAAARGLRAAASRPLDRGRIFLFLVDDLHISPSNLQRTRETLTRFVDEQLDLPGLESLDEPAVLVEDRHVRLDEHAVDAHDLLAPRGRRRRGLGAGGGRGAGERRGEE